MAKQILKSCLVFAAACVLICALLFLFSAALGVLFPSDAGRAGRTGAVPQPRIAISAESAGKLESLYQFTVTETVSTLAWSPDSRLLGIGTESQPFALDLPPTIYSLHLLDVETGRELVIYSDITVRFQDGAGTDVDFSPDGKILAYQTGPSISLWDVVLKNGYRTLVSDPLYGGYLTFSPDSKVIASINRLDDKYHKDHKLLRTWDVDTGREVPTAPKIPFADSTLSPDWKMVAASVPEANGPQLELFDAKSGDELRAIPGSPEVAFSSDGKVIAALDVDHTKKQDLIPTLVVDAASGRVINRLDGNCRYRSKNSFSPDDSLLASGAPNSRFEFAFFSFYPGRGQINVCDVGSGKRFSLSSNSDLVDDVAFSPDGRFLAMGGRDGTVQLFGIRPE